MQSLTLLDVIVLLCVGGGALLGLLRGFVYEVLALFAWVAAVIALKLFYTPVAFFLAQHMGSHAGASLLAFVGVFAVVFFAGRLIARRISRRTRDSILGPVDRVLGLGFGAIKGLIGVTLLFMLFNLLFDLGYGGASPRPVWVQQARSYALLQASRRAIDVFVVHRRAMHSSTATHDGNSTERGGAPI